REDQQSKEISPFGLADKRVPYTPQFIRAEPSRAHLLLITLDRLRGVVGAPPGLTQDRREQDYNLVRRSPPSFPPPHGALHVLRRHVGHGAPLKRRWHMHSPKIAVICHRALAPLLCF